MPEKIEHLRPDILFSLYADKPQAKRKPGFLKRCKREGKKVLRKDRHDNKKDNVKNMKRIWKTNIVSSEFFPF